MNLASPVVNTSSPVTFTPPHIVKRRAARWQGLQAEILQVTDFQSFEYGFRGPQHLLIASERSERDDGETQVEGLPGSSLHNLTRKLTFIPAGSRFHGWQKPRVLTRVTYFYIDPRGPLLDPALGFGEMEFLPRLFFFDADLWETALKLKAQVEQQHAGNQLYAEALGVVLCHELVRLNGGRTPAEPRATGGLAAWQEKRVVQHIAERLSERIALSELAELVRLSPFHFARSFKRSFGMPPHRYHMMRRMEEAKALLAQPDLSVTEIGMRQGFSETSAFTSAFHKLTGMSPTQYRRALS
jgi:AraC family transcriptional regulator